MIVGVQHRKHLSEKLKVTLAQKNAQPPYSEGGCALIKLLGSISGQGAYAATGFLRVSFGVLLSPLGG